MKNARITKHFVTLLENSQHTVMLDNTEQQSEWRTETGTENTYILTAYKYKAIQEQVKRLQRLSNRAEAEERLTNLFLGLAKRLPVRVNSIPIPPTKKESEKCKNEIKTT